jgi:hypothetical protein
MKTLKFVAYLFYRYYSTGATKDIPYFSTLCALVMLFGLHMFQILVVIDQMGMLPTKSTNTRGANFFLIALFLIPIFLLMALLVKREDLKQIYYEEKKIKRGYLFLILYTVLSIALLITLIEIKR